MEYKIKVTNEMNGAVIAEVTTTSASAANKAYAEHKSAIAKDTVVNAKQHIKSNYMLEFYKGGKIDMFWHILTDRDDKVIIEQSKQKR